MTSIEQIDLWRAMPSETLQLEFKKAKNSYQLEKLYEYCVALGNEDGGHLLFGIVDKLPRPVVGTAAFPNLMKTIEQVRIKVGFRVEMEEVNHPGGRVVVVSIPSRLKGEAFHLDGRYLMRSGESLVPMSDDRLRAIHAEGKPDWLEDVCCLGMTGQEVIDSLDTQAFFELLNEPFPTSSRIILKRLVAERLICEQNGAFDLLRVGGIMLARDLKDFSDLRRKAPRVVVYKGKSKIETKIDRFETRGYAVGFRGLVQFIMSQLPRNEVLQDAIRVEVEMVPEVAVRELVANALIHQDFMISGASVMIEVYDNRVEISSPGIPIVNIAEIVNECRSRNEHLADLMRRMHICEEKGSGIDKVYKAAELFQLVPPDIREEKNRTSAILFGPKPFSEMGRDERIRACWQHAGLRWVMREYMTNQSLRERFKLPDDKNTGVTVSQIIKATVDAEHIKMDKSVGKSFKLRRYLPAWA